MARLGQVSFELASVSANVEITDTNNSPSIATSPIFSGDKSVFINAFSNIRTGLCYVFASFATSGPIFVNFKLFIRSRPTAESTFLLLHDGSSVSSPGATVVKLTMDTTGAVLLYDEDSVIGSASDVLALGFWHRVEVQFDKTAAAGSHIVNAKINGTQFAGATDRSLSAGISAVNLGGNLVAETSSEIFYVEDITINNGSGSFQNTYSGAGKIIHLRPNAAGDNTGWESGTGSSFAEVDEVTPDDATTYLQDLLGTETSDFNIDATPNLISATDPISVVAVGFRGAAATALSADPFVLRVKASAAGTVEESANITFTATAYVTNAVATPRNYALVLYDLPGASTVGWTKADLDTAQIGVRATALGATGARVSTLWLSVEYNPYERASGVYFPYLSQFNDGKPI